MVEANRAEAEADAIPLPQGLAKPQIMMNTGPKLEGSQLKRISSDDHPTRT